MHIVVLPLRTNTNQTTDEVTANVAHQNTPKDTGWNPSSLQWVWRGSIQGDTVDQEEQMEAS